MRTGFLNKSVTIHESKLSPQAQAAYDHNTRNLGISAAEANEVGKAVALLAEAVSRPSWADRLRQEAEPTRAEAEELARAIAVYDAALARRGEARKAGEDAEREVHASLAAGGSWDRDDAKAARRTARAQAELVAAEQAFDLAHEQVEFASAAVGRARGAINVGGAARQRRYVGGRI